MEHAVNKNQLKKKNTHTRDHPCFRNSSHFKTVCNIRFNNLNLKCVLDQENICEEKGNINEPITICLTTEYTSWVTALLAACEWVVPDFQFLQMVGYVCLLCTSCTHIPMDSLTVVKLYTSLRLVIVQRQQLKETRKH